LLTFHAVDRKCIFAATCLRCVAVALRVAVADTRVIADVVTCTQSRPNSEGNGSTRSKCGSWLSLDKQGAHHPCKHQSRLDQRTRILAQQPWQYTSGLSSEDPWRPVPLSARPGRARRSSQRRILSSNARNHSEGAAKMHCRHCRQSIMRSPALAALWLTQGPWGQGVWRWRARGGRWRRGQPCACRMFAGHWHLRAYKQPPVFARSSN
jgi:hypothetical protein